MRESTLIAKSSIRRASPQLRLRTGLAWGIAVAVDAWLVWLKWWRLPNTIREIIRMFPETARIPARWVPWLRIATLASFAAICIGSNALVIAHGFSTPGFVYSLGLAAAASLIATVALVHGQWRRWLARRKRRATAL